jgi:23S rRNA pseudouridine2605 synthase
MLTAVGLEVVKLHRSKYGPLALGGLKPGRWRDLSADELKLLQ